MGTKGKNVGVLWLDLSCVRVAGKEAPLRFRWPTYLDSVETVSGTRVLWVDGGQRRMSVSNLRNKMY